MSTPSHLAPCVAVVGPANSGKTTFLHLLDRELQERPDRPLVYVVKGNPDGTGRYLYEAPELREALKPRVKGSWAPGTVDSICRWIDNCRASLELVVVDFGGRHDPKNERMLARCTDCLVVSRADEAGIAPEHGTMESWTKACRKAGLEPVARLRSLWGDGSPRLEPDGPGALEATFRSDVEGEGSAANAEIVRAVADALVGLRRERPSPPYLDLRARERWAVEDLSDLAGLAPRLEEMVRSGGPVLLGGRAPVWAHAAAMHRALDLDAESLVLVFDPKLGWNLVEIPAGYAPEPGSALDQMLEVSWRPASGRAGATLDVRITTEDKFLPPATVLELPRTPLPAEAPPPGPLVVSGALPIWLHLAFSRRLRTEYPKRTLGHWDAGTGRAILVHGPGAPGAEQWEG